MSDNESTPESTAPEPGAGAGAPLEHPERRLLLVGSIREFNRFCRERGLNPHSDRVRLVQDASHLRGRSAETHQLLFLAHWTDHLRDWREIYNVAIARGLAKPGRWGSDR